MEMAGPTEFDRERFENFMARGVTLHSEGRHNAAQLARKTAFEIAPDGSTEQGRAARDIGASYDRMGEPAEAGEWATRAYDIHLDLVSQADAKSSRQALRELSASELYVGITGLRKVIHDKLIQPELTDLNPLHYFRQAWKHIRAAKTQALGSINSKVDQYEINEAWRVSIAETIMGKPENAKRIGRRALQVALYSESPLLDTATPDLPRTARYRAKARALAGAAMAFGVRRLYTQHPSVRQKIALRLADKAL